MNKKYIVAVLLLLSFGVMSTLALSFTQTNLTENWDTIYTIQYGLSDLTLSEPTDTQLGSIDGDLTVSIPASSSVAVTPKITVEPLDSLNAIISTDDAKTYQITVELYDSNDDQLGSTQTITVNPGGSETPISGTATFTVSTDQIAYIVVAFNCPDAIGFGTSDGQAFETVYEKMRLKIEDA